MNHDGDVIGIVERFAVRSNVASSKFHFGDASRQINLEKSRRYLS